jgi:hypothetical protein
MIHEVKHVKHVRVYAWKYSIDYFLKIFLIKKYEFNIFQ